MPVLNLCLPTTCTLVCCSQYPSSRSYFDPKAFGVKVWAGSVSEAAWRGDCSPVGPLTGTSREAG